MSKQTQSMSGSLPKMAKVWEAVGDALGAYEFLSVRFAGSAAEFAGKEYVAVADKGEPVRFPSLTSALQYNAQMLKGMGFVRQVKVAQGAMSEAGQWGVWTVSGNVVEGKFRPAVGGKVFGIVTVVPVRKPQASEAPKAAPKAKADSPVKASVSQSPAAKPASAKKSRPAKSSPSTEANSPVSAEVLPEGIVKEGEKFRVGALLLPSLSMAVKALASRKAKDFDKQAISANPAQFAEVQASQSAEAVKPEQVQIAE